MHFHLALLGFFLLQLSGAFGAPAATTRELGNDKDAVGPHRIRFCVIVGNCP
ncbi:hypothetical protein PGT21_013819 [Puccinia graminis f. sp. tritici]|uniref:Uncharacterized protein n=1 Tax=Puccinia graminis f. sp. tritici TaxID=56615 RepID=A0A5B0P1E2_PUCGR|nr:hypothetical protein PGTUg99_025089 [Puccinia graminis f. sp. tritici]KAA1094220.1 hypothetical protein PGT21_013819 [Puccinia graminis f. sp. tritici]